MSSWNTISILIQLGIIEPDPLFVWVIIGGILIAATIIKFSKSSYPRYTPRKYNKR